MSSKKTPFFAILIVILCTILTSLGQYLIKLGTKVLSLDFMSIITNTPLILGFILYGFGAVLLIIALKYGELSVLYPFISLSFIWVAFISIFLLKEMIGFVNWAGFAAIIGGVSFIGVGGNHE